MTLASLCACSSPEPETATTAATVAATTASASAATAPPETETEAATQTTTAETTAQTTTQTTTAETTTTETTTTETTTTEITTTETTSAAQTSPQTWWTPAQTTAAPATESRPDHPDLGWRDNGKAYYVKVNTLCNTVTVYAKDAEGYHTVPVKAMVCSTGGDTPQNAIYSLYGQGKWPWLALFGNVYGRYATQITGNILFHSVPYLRYGDKSSIKYAEYDKLGTTCSMGCIRLVLSDAIWIYSNMANIAAVEFYSDSNPGPLGKPSAQKISGNETCRGWDPTDTDPENPWLTWVEETTASETTTDTSVSEVTDSSETSSATAPASPETAETSSETSSGTSQTETASAESSSETSETTALPEPPPAE